MFLKIGAMRLKAEDQNYEISVGYLIPDDEKVENPKIRPEFIYIIQKIVEDKLELYEPDDSPVFRQLDTTAKIYTKGFIDGISYYNEVYSNKAANDNKPKSDIITEK